MGNCMSRDGGQNKAGGTQFSDINQKGADVDNGHNASGGRRAMPQPHVPVSPPPTPAPPPSGN